MSRVRKMILWSVVGIVILGFLYIGFSVWVSMFNGDKLIIQWQLRHVIHNPVAIKSVSANKSTMEFLEHLPKNPKITSIQEDLDHNDKFEHYSADINGRYIDMYVHDIGWFAFYSVSKISVEGLPELPEFYMD